MYKNIPSPPNTNNNMTIPIIALEPAIYIISDINMSDQASLQKQSDAINAANSLYTNILDSDDPAMKQVQGLLVPLALQISVDAVTIDVLKRALRDALNNTIRIPIKASPGKFMTVSKSAISKMVKTIESQAIKKGGVILKSVTTSPSTIKAIAASAKVTKAAVQAAVKKAAQKAAVKAGTKVGTKVAVKVVTSAGEAAVKAMVTGGSVCALTGPETLGAGCVVGAVITALELAFAAVNIALDIIDPNGLLVIINKADIKAVANFTHEWIKNNEPTGNPDYFDEEIFFDVESHMLLMDDEGNLSMNDQWAAIYESYRDDYMNLLGIQGDWRSRLGNAVDVPNSNDPGVLSPSVIALQVLAQQLDQEPEPEPSSSSGLILFIIIFFVIIFLMIIIYFFIIEGDE